MMRITMRGWLLVCLGAAQLAQAQIPTDPLAGNLPGGSGAATAIPAAAANLPPPYVTRQTDVEIPFSVKAGTDPQSQPTAVRILVSWDQGRSWHFYDERRPEEKRFRFRPRQDGEYWFATQTIDRSGRADNAEPRVPQLRLVVDTQRPQLLVQSQVDGSGQVQVAWSATDASLAPMTLKIEYQDAAGNGGPWVPVEVSTGGNGQPTTQTTGQVAFQPKVESRAINLRAEIADTANNVAYYSRHLSLEPPAQAAPAHGPSADPTATRWTPEERQSLAQQQPAERATPPGVVDNPFMSASRTGDRQPQPSQELLPPSSNAPAAPVDSLPPPAEAAPAQQGTSGYVPAQGSGSPYGPAAGAQEQAGLAPRRGSQYSPDTAPPLGGAPSFDPLSMQSVTPQQPEKNDSHALQPEYRPSPTLVPDHDAPPRSTGRSGLGDQQGPEIMPTPLPTPTESVETPHGLRPRLTNSRRFSLEYDVESVGPEGVLAVELWGTADGGQTWIKWGADPDRASPFDVEVNSEAVYGFRIVIVGNNGLATSTPQPGDAADIWVQVDLSRPTARLTGAAYGQGPAAGKLDIRWEASDTNLGSRPVTLLIGDRPDGSFAPIAAGLPNTGQYLWEFDPRSPRQIYLRLEVRDEAGNVAVDQLTEPIRVEGLEPKGRIRGFQPGF